MPISEVFAKRRPRAPRGCKWRLRGGKPPRHLASMAPRRSRSTVVDGCGLESTRAAALDRTRPIIEVGMTQALDGPRNVRYGFGVMPLRHAWPFVLLLACGGDSSSDTPKGPNRAPVIDSVD